MKNPLTSNRFWALPEDSAEIILRDLSMRHGSEDTSVGMGPDGSWGVSSADGRTDACKSTQAGALTSDGAPVVTVGGVAVIPVDDVLVNAGKYGLRYATIRSRIQAALDDPKVGAILLDVDSPGGMVSGCQELAAFISEAAARKPMAAFTSSLMASAAYWIGSATGRVFCTETASVGSIGVIMTLVDCSKMLEDFGIRINVIASGKFKAAGHPAMQLSDEARAYFQTHAGNIHAVFRREVAKAMGLDESKSETWGDAQIFLGADAVNVGLATAVVSGFDEAVTRLSREVIMDRATLEAQYPELLASIIEEGKALALAEHSFTPESFLACVKSFMNADEFARAEAFFKACTDAKLTPEQVAVMAAARPAEAGLDNKRDTFKADMLKAMQAASPDPLKMDGSHEKEKSPLAQATERRFGK